MKRIKHGLSKTQEYRSWTKMKERCYDKNHMFYSKYGGSGITVDKRWLGSKGYINFIKDMGNKPAPEYTIDRIDNTANYYPKNCRWANKKQQAANTRSAKLHKGKPIAEWARILKVSNSTFHRHVVKNGYINAINHFSTPSTDVK